MQNNFINIFNYLKWVENITQTSDFSSTNINARSTDLLQLHNARSTDTDTSNVRSTDTNMNVQSADTTLHREIQSANSITQSTQISRNINNETEITGSNVENNTNNNDDLNRFLNDYELRHKLLNIKETINIREASKSYNKAKTKNKSRFEPRVILLRRKGDKNIVPKEGSAE